MEETLDPSDGLAATAGIGEGRVAPSWFAPSSDKRLLYIIEYSTGCTGVDDVATSKRAKSPEN